MKQLRLHVFASMYYIYYSYVILNKNFLEVYSNIINSSCDIITDVNLVIVMKKLELDEDIVFVGEIFRRIIARNKS